MRYGSTGWLPAPQKTRDHLNHEVGENTQSWHEQDDHEPEIRTSGTPRVNQTGNL
jgi:hypothetical protein